MSDAIPKDATKPDLLCTITRQWLEHLLQGQRDKAMAMLHCETTYREDDRWGKSVDRLAKVVTGAGALPDFLWEDISGRFGRSVFRYAHDGSYDTLCFICVDGQWRVLASITDWTETAWAKPETDEAAVDCLNSRFNGYMFHALYLKKT